MERAVLKQIMAILFALADLAECASGRSDRVRRLVLWFLYPAEAAARDFIAGAADDPDAPQEGDSPADAMRLARSFRALAMALGYMLQTAVPATPALRACEAQAGAQSRGKIRRRRALPGGGGFLETRFATPQAASRSSLRRLRPSITSQTRRSPSAGEPRRTHYPITRNRPQIRSRSAYQLSAKNSSGARKRAPPGNCGIFSSSRSFSRSRLPATVSA